MMPKSELDSQSMTWISLRQAFPIEEKVYYFVKDCKNEITGRAHYNGFDFDEVDWFGAQNGSLKLNKYLITHWSPNGSA